MGKRTQKKGEKTVRTGSKVICVDDRFPTEILLYYNALPTKNKTYTVRDMGVGVDGKGEPGQVVVYLVGLENPRSTTPPHPERGFAQFRFLEIEPPAEAENQAQELVEAGA
jgi:hypothetical protein